MNIHSIFPKLLRDGLATFVILFSSAQTMQSQVLITGTVYNHKSGMPLRGVSVLAVSGKGTATDSLGHYLVRLALSDTFYCSWLGKVTEKHAVKDIPPNQPFDFDLNEVEIRPLPALFVIGTANAYFQDSLSDRATYNKAFGYEGKSGPQERNLNQAGGVGLGWDLENMVQPASDNRSEALRQRLEENEKDKYIDHRFNQALVKKITRLDSPKLDSFMVWYRPSYYDLHEFESDYSYFQWISNTAKKFENDWNFSQAMRILVSVGFIW
jgi:hypothetical protein